jgi:hypothetical protein
VLRAEPLAGRPAYTLRTPPRVGDWKPGCLEAPSMGVWKPSASRTVYPFYAEPVRANATNAVPAPKCRLSVSHKGWKAKGNQQRPPFAQVIGLRFIGISCRQTELGNPSTGLEVDASPMRSERSVALRLMK